MSGEAGSGAKGPIIHETALHRYKPSDGDPNKKYTPPCASRAVDGAIRGAMVGLVWGAVFETYDARGVSFWKKIGRVGGSMLVNGFGFAAFLGTFSGVSCGCERIRERKDFLNPVVGGMAAGALIGIRSRNMQQIALTSIGTGMLTGFIFFVRGPDDNGI
jgi:hypothetical protein